MTDSSLEGRIRDVFTDAGCIGWMHARRIGVNGPEISLGADDLVVTASVYKLVLFVAMCRWELETRADPTETIRVVPSECTPGPTGLSTFRDPVVLSWRDIAASMMTVSDNAAADLILGRIGLDYVGETIRALGLDRTRVVGGTADSQRSIVIDANAHTTAEAFAALADNDAAWNVSAYDPAFASATTPREMTTLLDLIWTGQALPLAATQFVTSVMSQQVWNTRIRSGFASPEVVVAGKTGTIGVIRNEVATVEFPGETPIAVAVFTRAARADPLLAVVDRAIGTAARIAVTELRSGS